jgi:uncharacterized membrane protein
MNPLEEIILYAAKVWGLELLGWIANFTVVVQFLQKDMWKLRWWGIVAATLWFGYAVGIQSYPLMSLNLIIWVIQAYHLRKLSKERRENKKSTKKKILKDRHGA